MLTATKLNTQYAIDLSNDEMLKLLKLDYLDQVCPPLEKLGADDIDYDGHFGPCIFFRLGESNKKNLKKIIKVVEKLLGSQHK